MIRDDSKRGKFRPELDPSGRRGAIPPGSPRDGSPGEASFSDSSADVEGSNLAALGEGDGIATDGASEAITKALTLAASGSRQAAEELLPLLYSELRKLAAARLRRLPPGQTLQPTALVHEAYLRISDREPEGWEGKRHFFFAAARAMRDILVEDARRKSSLKRGGEHQRVALEDLGISVELPQDEILALDDVLEGLENDHPEHYQIVLLRYFAGLSGDETAAVLGLSTSTLKRKWRFARAWLYRSLASLGQSDLGPSDETSPE